MRSWKLLTGWLNCGELNREKMSDFKTRLVEEESELKEKIEKLYDFTQSDKIDSVGDFQKNILLIQLESMRTYWRCLTARIVNFTDNESLQLKNY